MIKLLLVFAFLCASTAYAAPRIVDPWPDRDALDIAARNVVVDSSDPFTPADIGRAPARRVTAQLYLPRDASAAHPAPAVVFLHGSGGNIAERGGTYGPQLAAMGIAAIVLDTYASRADLGDTFLARVFGITETMFVADAYAALRTLAARPDIDARRVVLAGFSYGGMATTYAMYAQIADKLAPPGLRFAGHVAFYGPCIARFSDSRTTGAPLLMLYGAQDELMDPRRCEEVASDLRGGGSQVDIISYPGAVHQWDGAFARRTIGRQLAACDYRVERDGTIRDRRTLIAMTGPFTRKLTLALCTGSKPYPIGRDDRVRALSNRDFGRFLTRVFRLAPAL